MLVHKRDEAVYEGSSIIPRGHEISAWPTLAAPHVERPGLRDLLDEIMKRRICLVTGAAGWGKSTALAAWADKSRTAWLTLDADDARLGRFAYRLLLALRPYLTGLPVDAAVGLDAGEDEQLLRFLPATICNWIQAQVRGDFVLVLDDLQELPSACTTARFVERVCRQPSNVLHMVLVSRDEPPFSLERLRGRGLVAEIDASQLAFDVVEVAALLRATVGDDPPGLAGRLHEATAGWPAAARLAAERLRGVGAAQRPRLLERLSRPSGPLRAYLIEEVLDRRARA